MPTLPLPITLIFKNQSLRFEAGKISLKCKEKPESNTQCAAAHFT